jgi:hypothetical protein
MALEWLFSWGPGSMAPTDELRLDGSSREALASS